MYRDQNALSECGTNGNGTRRHGQGREVGAGRGERTFRNGSPAHAGSAVVPPPYALDLSSIPVALPWCAVAKKMGRQSESLPPSRDLIAGLLPFAGALGVDLGVWPETTTPDELVGSILGRLEKAVSLSGCQLDVSWKDEEVGVVLSSDICAGVKGLSYSFPLIPMLEHYQIANLAVHNLLLEAAVLLNEWVGVISLLEYSQDHLDEFEERLEWEDDDEALDDLNDRMELMRADVERAQVVFFKVNAFPASLNSFKARLAFGSLPEKWVAWGNQVLSLLDSNEHMENYTWQGFYDSFLDVEPGVAGEDDGYDDDGYVEGVTPNLCFFVATGLDSLDEYHLDHINNDYSSFGSNFPYLQKAFTTPNALIEMLKTMEQTHSFWYNMVAVFSFADEEFELMKGEKCND